MTEGVHCSGVVAVHRTRTFQRQLYWPKKKKSLSLTFTLYRGTLKFVSFSNSVSGLLRFVAAIPVRI